MKIIKVTLVILLLFLPFFVQAGTIYLTPSRFLFPEEGILGNQTYRFSFYTSNTTDQKITFHAEIDCTNEDRSVCGNPDWYKFNKKNFTLEAGESTSIDLRLNVPKNIRNKSYENVLAIYPELPVKNGENSNSIQMKIVGAIGAGIYFTKSGNIGKGKELLYFLQDKIGTKISSGMARAGLDQKSSLVVSSVLLAIFLAFTLSKILFKKLFRRNKTDRKPKLEFQPGSSGTPVLDHNLLDLRGVKPSKSTAHLCSDND